MANGIPPRTPTNRWQAWSWWRDFLAGKTDEVPNDPQPGFYKAKRHKDGDYIPASIDLSQVVEDGELMEDERFVCVVGAWERDADEQWPFLAKHPVSEREHAALMTRPKVTNLSRQVIT